MGHRVKGIVPSLDFMVAMIVVIVSAFTFQLSPVFAQNTNTLTTQTPPVDVTSSGFKFTVCDGPAGAPNVQIPCDFTGLMLQVQRLIDIAIVLGVFVAIIGFCYAGYLYISGTPDNISKAHTIFLKVFEGLLIMLAAWFIVYQILSWLTGNSGFMTLLGKPS